MDALENAAFPLRARGTPKGDARKRATDLLARLGFPSGRLRAKPESLSGGETQRVALARALIHHPRLLLLDEPTSSLDVAARGAIRPLLREILEAFDGVRVLVTHDPVEAMTLADRIVVLEDGRVSREGTPDELRDSPRTPYVAELVGLNLYSGTLEPLEPGAGRLRTADGDLIVAWPPAADPASGPVAGVTALLRPADVTLHTTRPDGGSARNLLQGRVASISREGDRARVRIASRPPVVAEITLGSVDRLGLTERREVWAGCKAVEIRLELPGADPSPTSRPTAGTLSG
jgi:molybdopterin-binding protein